MSERRGVGIGTQIVSKPASSGSTWVVTCILMIGGRLSAAPPISCKTENEAGREVAVAHCQAMLSACEVYGVDRTAILNEAAARERAKKLAPHLPAGER
jgi:hypothetical protein